MIGEVLKSIDIFGNDEVIFTTESGKRYKMYHYQNCCERVKLIDDYEEVLKSMVGKKVERLDIEYYDGSEHPAHDVYDSSTISEFTFRVNGATEIIKWFGNSNGYYCEKAELEEIK